MMFDLFSRKKKTAFKKTVIKELLASVRWTGTDIRNEHNERNQLKDKTSMMCFVEE